MVGAGFGGLEDFLFFCSGTVWGRLRVVKNLIFSEIIEAHRRNPHLERKNRIAVEDA